MFWAELSLMSSSWTFDNPTFRCYSKSCFHISTLGAVDTPLPCLFLILTNSLHPKLPFTVYISACVLFLATLETLRPRMHQTIVSALYFQTYWFHEGIPMNFKWHEKYWFRAPFSGCLKNQYMWVHRTSTKHRCEVGACVCVCGVCAFGITFFLLQNVHWSRLLTASLITTSKVL